MKIRTLAALLLLVGTFACTQRTCPTYTKDDIKKTEQVEQNKEKV